MVTVSRHKNRKKRPKRKKRKSPERNNTQEVPVLTVSDNVSNYASLHPLILVLGLFCNNFLQNCTGFLHLFISILGYFCMILQECMGQFKLVHISQKKLNLRVLGCFRINSRKYAEYFQIDPCFQFFFKSQVWAYFCINLQKYAGCLKLTYKFQTFFKVTDLHKLAQKRGSMQVIFKKIQICANRSAYFAKNCKKMQNIFKKFLIFQIYQYFCQNGHILPVLIMVYAPWALAELRS